MDSSARKAIWNQLRDIALADGKLSHEEQELMTTIILDIERYNQMIQQALDDGIIDVSEERELFEGRMKILEKAYDKAREDKTISEDEKRILKEICVIVRDFI